MPTVLVIGFAGGTWGCTMSATCEGWFTGFLTLTQQTGMELLAELVPLTLASPGYGVVGRLSLGEITESGPRGLLRALPGIIRMNGTERIA